MSSVIYPVWKYTHKGCPPPTPPHAGAAADGAGVGGARERGCRRRGWEWVWGETLMGIFPY